MPTPTKGSRLGGSPSHERLMLANLATSLFEHGRITTTQAKARRVQPLAEKLITKAKRGDLHNRRLIQRVVPDKDVVHKLMAEIGPFYLDRDGGYTRVVKTTPRKGDNAAMAVIELVPEKTATVEAEKARGTTFAKDQPQAGADAAAAGAAAGTGEAVEATEVSTADAVAESAETGPDSAAAEETAPEGADDAAEAGDEDTAEAPARDATADSQPESADAASAETESTEADKGES